MGGKMNRAAALRINTVPRARLIWLSSAFTSGLTAAMALPPQIAVPLAIRYEVFLSTVSFRPRNAPRVRVRAMLKTVSRTPFPPACMALSAWMPKPRPTMAIFSRVFTASRLSFSNGLPIVLATTIPAKSARAGERMGCMSVSGMIHRLIRIKKTIRLHFSLKSFLMSVSFFSGCKGKGLL